MAFYTRPATNDFSYTSSCLLCWHTYANSQTNILIRKTLSMLLWSEKHCAFFIAEHILHSARLVSTMYPVHSVDKSILISLDCRTSSVYEYNLNITITIVTSSHFNNSHITINHQEKQLCQLMNAVEWAWGNITINQLHFFFFFAFCSTFVKVVQQ